MHLKKVDWLLLIEILEYETLIKLTAQAVNV